MTRCLTGAKKGITVISDIPASMPLLSVLNNDIYFRARPAVSAYGFKGIYVQGIHGGNVNNNTIVNEGTENGQSNKNFEGVKIDNCKGLHLNVNQVTGLSGSGLHEDKGIYIVGSTGCVLGCNTVDKLRYGVYFAGDCMGTSLRADASRIYLM